jgi:hypothetical protein
VEPERVVDTEVYASHFQFYLVDPGVEGRGFDWGGADLERRLGVGESMIAVGTVAYEFVPVRLEVWPGEPPLDDAWDHVVEAPFAAATGRVALENVDGPAEHSGVEVEAGPYRVRAAAAGLDDATEEGGDRYLLQLWPAAVEEPRVLRWWPPWDPAAARPEPTTEGGRVLLGAAAHDARLGMRWLAGRGQAHLFADPDGTLWEHSTLLDAAGTPQLEELDEAEAERRYGPRTAWGTLPWAQPRAAALVTAIVRAGRSRRGRRPKRDGRAS